ncbi:MAG: alpha,alpha-trehalase TreA [Saprospiraceae bacterium]|nr:alpha,alpha-trehalase TreA [Saprospiraceae bacterium]
MNNPHLTPDIIYGSLFDTVQKSGIFSDSKSFADAVPKFEPTVILKNFEEQKNTADFNLRSFVLKHFAVPKTTKVKIRERENIKTHIEKLWKLLKRKADKNSAAGSLIALPFPYIIPGGRFREIYYWDSYFTMLGLLESGHNKTVVNMLDNFAWLIEQFGHIPNGNRSYFLSRSQPPFFAAMVELISEYENTKEYHIRYLKPLLKEYNFWMDGKDDLSSQNTAIKRVVSVSENIVLNRYWDDNPVPRQESYAEDISHSVSKYQSQSEYYLNIRAACESGWDFSSRWFGKSDSLKSIQTTTILPVDLNVLLFRLEDTISKAFVYFGEPEKAEHFKALSTDRKSAINSVFWNNRQSCYQDFNFKEGKHSGRKSLATVFPLWQNISSKEQSVLLEDHLKKHFLRPGGLVTTTYNTGQQWDAPNGWAPLQWIAVEGLINYGFFDLAKDVAQRWIHLVERVYNNTGKLMEKYNVEDMNLDAGGGEYPVQDGFGWTNGVYLALRDVIR